MSASVADSLKRIGAGGVDFVTLNIELKDGNCAAIAEALLARSIPFIYVSGYLPGDYPDMPPAPWVEKPASDNVLMTAALKACMGVDRLSLA